MQQLKSRKSGNKSMNTPMNNSMAYPGTQPTSPASRNNQSTQKIFKPQTKFNIGKELSLNAPKTMLGKYSTSTKTSARKQSN